MKNLTDKIILKARFTLLNKTEPFFSNRIFENRMNKQKPVVKQDGRIGE